MAHDDPIAALVDELRAAQSEAARIVGAPARGTRVVDLAPGARWYLCAFEGPAFVCLTADRQPESDPHSVHQVAACALLVEHAESLVDGGELEVLAAVARRLVGQLDGEADGVLGAIDEGALALGAWSAAPARAIASLPALDTAVRLHDALRAAYERFVELTEPLVARQSELPGELVTSLQELDEAAGRSGAAQSLGAAIAEAMDPVSAGADEIVAAHVPRLSQSA